MRTPRILWIIFACALSIGLSAGAPPRAAAQPSLLVLGVSGEGGGFVADAQGAFGGAAARLGVRPLPLISVYLQSHGLIGALSGGPKSGQATGVLWNTLMLGLHFGVLEL